MVSFFYFRRKDVGLRFSKFCLYFFNGSFLKVISAPLTRFATGATWYAGNRLGVNELVGRAWGIGYPHACDIIAITRVMEKPVLLSIELLKQMVSELWSAEIASGELEEKLEGEIQIAIGLRDFRTAR